MFNCLLFINLIRPTWHSFDQVVALYSNAFKCVATDAYVLGIRVKRAVIRLKRMFVCALLPVCFVLEQWLNQIIFKRLAFRDLFPRPVVQAQLQQRPEIPGVRSRQPAHTANAGDVSKKNRCVPCFLIPSVHILWLWPLASALPAAY